MLVVDLVYEKKKKKLIFVCLFSKWAKLKSRLESTTKQPKFKHNNVLVNKLVRALALGNANAISKGNLEF